MRFSLLISFIGVVVNSFSQSAQLDSLQRVIDKKGETKEKVALLNQLTFSQFAYDVEIAGVTNQRAIELAQKTNDKAGEGWATTYKALYYYFIGNLKEAERLAAKSTQMGKANLDTNLEGYSLNQLGNIYRNKGVFDSAFFFYRAAERILERSPNLFYQSIVKLNKGRCYLVLNKPDSALLEVQEAFKHRQAMKNTALMPEVWIMLGNCYRQLYEPNEAERYYSLALQTSPKASVSYASYLLGMGELYFRRGEFERALESWSQVLAVHRKLSYQYEISSLLYRMGEVYEELGFYQLALESLSRSLKMAQSSDYRFLLGELYFELAWVFYRNKNFEEATQNIRRAEEAFLKINQTDRLPSCWNVRGLIQFKKNNFDSSLYFHQRSLRAREEFGDKISISSSLFNIGELFNAKKEYKKALTYLWPGVEIDESVGDNYGKGLYYYQIGKSYNRLGVKDSAKYYLERAVRLAIPTSASDLLRNSYFEMADYLKNSGKPTEAIVYYQKYIRVNDSLYNKQNAQSLSAYRTLYDVETKDKEIELLNQKSLLATAQAQKQRILFYTVVVGFLILVGLAIFYYRFAKRLRKLTYSLAEKSEEIQTQAEELTEANQVLSKLNREISEQKEEIQAQAEELTESNQAISGINETLEERIDARTSELKQAYKELDTFFYRSSHDFRRPLTTFMGLAEVAKITVKDQWALELFEKVNETAQNLDKMLMKLQSISDLGVEELLYKQVFIEEAFHRKIDSFGQELLQKNIKVEIHAPSTLSFYSYPALLKIILDNLIENAIFFKATVNSFIRLNAYTHSEGVMIEVEDNGQGIEEEFLGRVFEMYFRGNEHSKGNGLGLYIVKKTIDKLGGVITISSKLGVGTKVSIFFPHQVEKTLH
ncbi:MAG: tetratricopeptide repeat protein [Cyclobacteriaceae bacterium]|nr:tetratricopeptide repeat protein [Cyclobacteriaceae bacterium]